MSKYNLVATGGTFDILHAGHIALLSKSFEVSDKVIIGLTGDELASKKNKTLLNSYSRRLSALIGLIATNFSKASYQINRLDEDFGPAVLEGKVQALVVSEETAPQGDVLNRLRSERGLDSVDVIVVPMVLAKDGARISTSRIKNSEIDSEGNLTKN